MAEENLSPISAPKPPAVNPLGAATSAHASTLKLKPVIRKPTIGGGLRPGLKLPTQTALKKPAPAAAPAPAAPAHAAVDQLKSMTQKLKGITQQIPVQAILHKTGIIADQGLTDEQKQASKSRTARISLAEVGVSTAQNEAAPMKTIRIKRPGDLKPAASATAPAAEVAPAPAAASSEKAPEAEASTLTQRKTLKIARPTAGAVRPTGKFGVKKPGAPAKPEAEAEGEVADIPDLSTAPMPAPAPVADNRISDVPAGLAVFDLLLQVAACAGIFFLSYLLYLDAEAQWF